MSFKITSPDPYTFKEISVFVKTCEVLESHPPHVYKIILDYFGDTSLIARDINGKIVGWTFGLVSQKDPEIFFLWQIGVEAGERNSGIGSALLQELINCARLKKCTRMRATVEPQNLASKLLFEKAGFKNVSETCLFDHYGEGEEMILFDRII